MKSFLFKPEIWTAKKRVLEERGEAVTRRLMKSQPTPVQNGRWLYLPKEGVRIEWTEIQDMEQIVKYAPYTLGEVVYVKEAWAIIPMTNIISVEYKDEEVRNIDDAYDNINHPAWNYDSTPYCRSPLFMPEWAARSFVKIKEIRAERFYFTNLTSHEYNLEGGHASADYLHSIDGQWVWRILFKEVRSK